MIPPTPRARWAPSASGLTTLAWLGVAVTYLVTRLANLTRLPLFIDEGTYLWWGRQLLLGDFSRGWGQGKPLAGWLIALPLALGADQVLATRAGMVLLGALGLAATTYLAARHLSMGAALLAAAFWVLLPFSLFFERVATPDVQLGCLVMVTLALTWHTLHAGQVRPVLALATGAFFVLAALTKLPVSLFFFGLPAGVLLVSTPARGRVGKVNAFWLTILPALFAAGVVALGAYRWSSGARPIGFGFDDVLLKSAVGAAGGSPLANNLVALLGWSLAYLGWPVTLALAVAWLAAWFGPPLVRLLAGASALWLAIFVSIADFWVPRYVWPVLPMLVLILGWGASALVAVLSAWMGSREQPVRPGFMAASLGAAVVLGAAIVTAPFVGAILASPERAPLPEVDQQAYVTEFGSGYGFPEAAAYLGAVRASAAGTSQMIALTISDEARLRAYLAPAQWPALRQVHIVGGQNQDSAQQLALLKAWLLDASTTYVVVSSNIQWGANWRRAFPQAVLDRQFPKPGGADAVQVWRLTSP